ncbi:hypothetical protein [Desulfitibacter alkalitolerans]|uniref:hypothetical protein n=1 Tax=Desulfitibacter alkalitolerans TaxID=264641 RepID=UPI0004892BCC|nr:hypothetical protein [Desulfitibacter alkalitolerans]
MVNLKKTIILILTVCFIMISFPSNALALSVSISPKSQSDYLNKTFEWRITVSGQDSFDNSYGDGNLSIWINMPDGTYYDQHNYEKKGYYDGIASATSGKPGEIQITIYDKWNATVM